MPSASWLQPTRSLLRRWASRGSHLHRAPGSHTASTGTARVGVIGKNASLLKHGAPYRRLSVETWIISRKWSRRPDVSGRVDTHEDCSQGQSVRSPASTMSIRSRQTLCEDDNTCPRGCSAGRRVRIHKLQSPRPARPLGRRARRCSRNGLRAASSLLDPDRCRGDRTADPRREKSKNGRAQMYNFLIRSYANSHPAWISAPRQRGEGIDLANRHLASRARTLRDEDASQAFAAQAQPRQRHYYTLVLGTHEARRPGRRARLSARAARSQARARRGVGHLSFDHVCSQLLGAAVKLTACNYGAATGL